MVAVVVLAPKIYIWEQFKNKVVEYNLNITEQNIREKKALHVDGLSVSWSKIPIVNSQNVSISLYGAYNTIVASKCELPALSLKMDNATVKYSVLEPLHVKIFAHGNFGEIKGFYELSDNKISLKLEPAEGKQSHLLYRYFKKTEEGYVYELSL